MYDVLCTLYDVPTCMLYYVRCTIAVHRTIVLYVLLICTYVHSTMYLVRVPCTSYHVRRTLYDVHRKRYIVHIVHRTMYYVPRTMYKVQGTRYDVQGTRYIVHRTYNMCIYIYLYVRCIVGWQRNRGGRRPRRRTETSSVPLFCRPLMFCCKSTSTRYKYKVLCTSYQVQVPVCPCST